MKVDINEETLRFLKSIEKNKCLVSEITLINDDGEKTKMMMEFCRVGDNEWKMRAKAFDEEMQGTISIKDIDKIRFERMDKDE